ncbi:MAG: Crp/Fnr family transcriptional regulator [Wenzhouxiangella sp.]
MDQKKNVTETDLAQFPLLASLNPKQLSKNIARARVVKISRGNFLFHQGDPARRIYLCRQGQLKLFRLASSGQEKIIAIINPGRSFAEATLFMPDRRYPVHCAALVNSEVVGFDADELLECLKTDPAVCFELMTTLCLRTQHKIGQIENLSLQNAHLRVAGYLLDEFKRQTHPKTFKLTASKKNIAGLLAIQPETFSRSLAQLQREGVLEVNARSITVNQPEQLEGIVRGMPLQ